MTDKDTLTTLAERFEQASGPDRFWSKVERGGTGGCWPWTASTNWRGYGQYSVGRRSDGSYRMLKAHRVAYEMAKGSIPTGLHIDHLCRNRLCCNPDHLEVVTPAENNKRAGAAKSACRRGHAFTPENTTTGKNGTRECRTCRLHRKRQARARASSPLLSAEQEVVG